MNAKQSPKKRRASAGFTLIEIMVVITLIGLIATIVVPKVMLNVDKGNIVATKAKMTNVKGVLNQYRLTHGKYPDSLSELMEPDDKNLGESWVDDPMILRDSWGQEFIYNKNSSHKFEVVSLGSDGLEGGEGVDADISSDASKMPNN